MLLSACLPQEPGLGAGPGHCPGAVTIGALCDTSAGAVCVPGFGTQQMALVAQGSGGTRVAQGTAGPAWLPQGLRGEEQFLCWVEQHLPPACSVCSFCLGEMGGVWEKMIFRWIWNKIAVVPQTLPMRIPTGTWGATARGGGTGGTALSPSSGLGSRVCSQFNSTPEHLKVENP